MLSKNNPQMDFFTQTIYDKLVPKDHLLVKIDSLIDFSFVYETVADRYSKNMGRSSRDPVMMVKIILLEYLYNLSDVEVAKRAATDIVFRWFLGLSIEDTAPDDTTISHFRIKRIGKEKFESFFDEIVKQCIDKDLVKGRRYIIDSTDVAVNASLPFGKKLIRDAFRKVVREIENFDEALAQETLNAFEADIAEEYESGEKVDAAKHYEIALKHLEQLYIKTHEELLTNDRYQTAFQICYDIADGHLHRKKDKIVSAVDPDARTAYKSPGKAKIGYKDHIVMDEDSEIILASMQTPFNVGDEKALSDLVTKAEELCKAKPEEVTADKVYGTVDNRLFLMEQEITTNIPFYDRPDSQTIYGIQDFTIAENLKSVTCPNGIKTKDITYYPKTEKRGAYYVARFQKKNCSQCPLRDSCLYISKKEGKRQSFRKVTIPAYYKVILRDRKRVETLEFEEAYRKRFKVERRFGTITWNHGLRRSRYVGLERTSIHIIMANMTSNVIRMVNLLWKPQMA
jgi:transposase